MSYTSLIKKSNANAKANNLNTERIDIFADSNMPAASRRKFIEDRITEFAQTKRSAFKPYKARWADNLYNHIVGFHQSQHAKLDPYKLDQNWLHGFLTFLTVTPHRRKITNSGIAIHIETLIDMLDHFNIAYNWELPSYLAHIERKKSLPDEILTEEEIEMFWKLEKEIGRRPGRKKGSIHILNITLDRFLISLYTGMRRSEVRTAFTSYDAVTDTDLIGFYARKNQRAKIIPMHPRIKPIIERGWYKSAGGISWDTLMKHVTITGHGQVIERIGHNVNRTVVPRSQIVHFHSARQTFTVRMIEKGMDIYELSKLLGHSSVSVTERYYALVREKHMIEKTKEVFKNLA